MDERARGAAAGAAAAVFWAAAEPALKRAFRTPYSDTEAISAFVTRGPLQPLAGIAIHTANGAAFGYLFVRLGGRGVRQGLVAALAENTLLWPLTGILDRIHPDRRDGGWPPILTSPRAFASATAGHALFGVALGALGPRRIAP